MSAAGGAQTASLDELLNSCAAAAPGALALAGAVEQPVWSFAALDAEVSRVAALLRAFELGAGASVLVTGAASPHTLIAAVAAQRAGLRTALAPLSFGPESLAAACAACGAAALIGAGGHEFGNVPALLAVVAAASPGVRVVASCGAEDANGVVNLDDNGESAPPAAAPALPLATFARAVSKLTLAEQDAAKLAAAALELRQAWPAGAHPVLSTLAPVTLAGLVSGPMAAWIAGAPIWLHGPFDSRRFAEALERARRAHVIAPAGLAAHLAAAAASGACVSLTLLRREADGPIPALAAPQKMQILELHAIGERSVRATGRGLHRAPARPDLE